jgi:hypothetical protein
MTIVALQALGVPRSIRYFEDESIQYKFMTATALWNRCCECKARRKMIKCYELFGDRKNLINDNFYLPSEKRREREREKGAIKQSQLTQ